MEKNDIDVKTQIEEIKKKHPESYRILIVAMNVVVYCMQAGMKKSEYMSYCENVFDNVLKTGTKAVVNFLQIQMQKDIENFINENSEKSEANE